MTGPKLLGTSRNEFGVCVGPGNMHNGAVWIYNTRFESSL